MTVPREVVAAVRRLDEAELRQLIILARGLLLESESPVIEVTDLPGMPAVRYRQKLVRCNRPACGTCPHGPYWYAHWVEGGRKRSQYIGRELPAEVRRRLEAMDAEAAAAAAAAQVAQAVNGDPTAPSRFRLRLVTSSED